MNRLRERALALGASAAEILAADRLSSEDDLAAFCTSCEGYGQTANCPPQVMTAAQFRERLRGFGQVLVFRIDVPARVLMTDERFPYSRQIHEMAAELERAARADGYAGAAGLAAGSCKPLFCGEFDGCAVLEGGTCRYPDGARPSVSGFGINVFRLCEVLGWEIRRMTRESAPGDTETGMLVGMVLF